MALQQVESMTVIQNYQVCDPQLQSVSHDHKYKVTAIKNYQVSD